MIRLALKNIFRNRRRTIITLFLVVSGTFLLASMRFLTYGMQQDMIFQVVRLDSGYLEVAAYGWKEKPTLNRALQVTAELQKNIQLEQVKGLSPRIRSGALLSYKKKTRFISVLAANPEKERQITNLHKVIKEGKAPLNKEGIQDAMIGYRMARSLEIKIGETFYLITSQLDGSMGAIALRLSGIYRANNSGMDSKRVVTTLKAGEELFGTRLEQGTFYTSLALAVPDYLVAAKVKKIFKQKFPPPTPVAGVRPEESEIYKPVILDWEELNPGIMDMVRIAQQKMGIFLIFFIVSISFGVLNTVQMSIQERTREFGVLLAIGTSDRQLLRMLLYEICFLVIPGVLLGMLAAAGVCTYLNFYPIDLTGTQIGNIYESMGAMARYRPIVDLSEFWFTALALILPAVLMGLVAARRIFRLNPIQSINTI